MKLTDKCTVLILATALVMQAVMPGAQADAKKASKPVLSRKTVEVKEGTQKKVTVKNATGYKLTVKSKNKKIATVSKKGKTAFVVKGVKSGKTKVICTAKKKKKKVTLTCAVNVTKKSNTIIQPTASPTPANTNAGTTTAPVPTATSVPTATPEPTATSEPSISSFPKTDEFSDVPYDFADASENVKKGTIEEFTYTSTTTNSTHKVLVQLPANYSQENKYPVLYLFHGENDTESVWKDMTADQIMDNAIAFKAAKEMIVVMPNISGAKDEDLIQDFANDLV